MPNTETDGGSLVTTLRYLAAATSAALTASAVAGLTSGNLGIVYLAFWIALVHAVVLGIPAAVALHKRGRIGFVAAVLTGFAVGIIPTGSLTIAALVQSNNNWLDALKFVGFSGLFGAVGGLGAWLTWIGSKHAPWTWIATVSTIAVLVLSVPAITKDRSCHNVFRDGRSSIRPVLIVEMRLESADWPALEKIVKNFAGSKNWSYRGPSKTRLGFSVCSEDGTNIHSWLVTPERGFSISIFQPQGGSSWEAPARALVKTIEVRWPGKPAITVGPDLLDLTPSVPMR